ncbi:MAG TPA: hypothetical protein VHF25_12385 [Nitriliruptorales bacterium]|nr:hypothetical protein [Nitriliruptorales bacterium]
MSRGRRPVAPPSRTGDADPDPSQRAGIGERLERLLSRWTAARRRLRSPKTDRALLLVAFAVFVVVSVVAYLHLRSAGLRFRWDAVLILLVVGTPAMVAVTTAEFMVLARCVGERFSVRESVRVSLLSSAANLLPVPGAVLVRTRALRQRDTSYTDIGRAVGGVGLALVGVAGLFSGIVIFVANAVLGLAGIVVGGAAVLAATTVLRWQAGRSGQTAPVAGVLVAETALVAVIAFRLWAALAALGYAVRPAQVGVLTAASVAAAAAAVFPAGLGLREVLAGAFSPLISLPVAAGVFTGSVDRLTFFAGLVPITLFLGARRLARGRLPDGMRAGSDGLTRSTGV